MRTLIAALVASTALWAHAQSACSSDGQPQPVVLYERFINADCDSCWADAPAHVPAPSALVLDWIVPGSLGNDAPLSAAATRDALSRLQTLQRPIPLQTETHISNVLPATLSPGRLRVATGPAINDYLGTGISLLPLSGRSAAPRNRHDYQFYLVLVEAIPTGAEGNPTPRYLARNTLQGLWNKRNQLPNKERIAWMENRPMRIPDGARAERLRVVGWLQDSDGRVVAAAQARCTTEQ